MKQIKSSIIQMVQLLKMVLLILAVVERLS